MSLSYCMCVNGAVCLGEVGSVGNVACVNQRWAIEFVWLSCEHMYTCSAVTIRHVAAHSFAPVGSIAAVGQLPETTTVEKSASGFMERLWTLTLLARPHRCRKAQYKYMHFRIYAHIHTHTQLNLTKHVKNKVAFYQPKNKNKYFLSKLADKQWWSFNLSSLLTLSFIFSYIYILSKLFFFKLNFHISIKLFCVNLYVHLSRYQYWLMKNTLVDH